MMFTVVNGVRKPITDFAIKLNGEVKHLSAVYRGSIPIWPNVPATCQPEGMSYQTVNPQIVKVGSQYAKASSISDDRVYYTVIGGSNTLFYDRQLDAWGSDTISNVHNTECIFASCHPTWNEQQIWPDYALPYSVNGGSAFVSHGVTDNIETFTYGGGLTYTRRVGYDGYWHIGNTIVEDVTCDDLTGPCDYPDEQAPTHVTLYGRVYTFTDNFSTGDKRYWFNSQTLTLYYVGATKKWYNGGASYPFSEAELANLDCTCDYEAGPVVTVTDGVADITLVTFQGHDYEVDNIQTEYVSYYCAEEGVNPSTIYFRRGTVWWYSTNLFTVLICGVEDATEPPPPPSSCTNYVSTYSYTQTRGQDNWSHGVINGTMQKTSTNPDHYSGIFDWWDFGDGPNANNNSHVTNYGLKIYWDATDSCLKFQQGPDGGIFLTSPCSTVPGTFTIDQDYQYNGYTYHQSGTLTIGCGTAGICYPSVTGSPSKVYFMGTKFTYYTTANGTIIYSTQAGGYGARVYFVYDLPALQAAAQSWGWTNVPTSHNIWVLDGQADSIPVSCENTAGTGCSPIWDPVNMSPIPVKVCYEGVSYLNYNYSNGIFYYGDTKLSCENGVWTWLPTSTVVTTVKCGPCGPPPGVCAPDGDCDGMSCTNVDPLFVTYGDEPYAYDYFMSGLFFYKNLAGDTISYSGDTFQWFDGSNTDITSSVTCGPGSFVPCAPTYINNVASPLAICYTDQYDVKHNYSFSYEMSGNMYYGSIFYQASTGMWMDGYSSVTLRVACSACPVPEGVCAPTLTGWDGSYYTGSDPGYVNIANDTYGFAGGMGGSFNYMNATGTLIYYNSETYTWTDGSMTDITPSVVCGAGTGFTPCVASVTNEVISPAQVCFYDTQYQTHTTYPASYYYEDEIWFGGMSLKFKPSTGVWSNSYGQPCSMQVTCAPCPLPQGTCIPSAEGTPASVTYNSTVYTWDSNYYGMWRYVNNGNYIGWDPLQYNWFDPYMFTPLDLVTNGTVTC